MYRTTFALTGVLLLTSPTSGAAQANGSRFQIGAHVVAVSSGEFDSTDVGLGVRGSWNAWSLLAVDTEIGVYPSEWPDTTTPFSRHRVEGFFGATAGPVIGRVRPFAKLRPGFVTFEQAPLPFACIAIFPPPLACRLASGATMFALDLGGGLEVFPSARTVVRVDAGDRLLRYPGPVLDSDFTARAESFFGHDFRFNLGAGWRF
jgi:hypothetical protein